MGRHPVPTPILALRGSWRAKTRQREPRAVPGTLPICPDWLDDAARAVWATLIPQLAELNIVAPVDEFALARYVTMLVQWRDLYTVIETAAPEVDCRAVERALFKLSDALLRLEREFGMTASARAKLGMELHQALPPEKAKQPKSRFFCDTRKPIA